MRMNEAQRYTLRPRKSSFDSVYVNRLTVNVNANIIGPSNDCQAFFI
jgi:hypothetical protein